MRKIDLKITITSSKILAYVILVVCSVYSFLYESAEVLIFAISIAGGLHGLRSWSEGLTRRREIQHRNWGGGEPYYNDYDYDYDNYDEKQKPNDEIG